MKYAIAITVTLLGLHSHTSAANPGADKVSSAVSSQGPAIESKVVGVVTVSVQADQPGAQINPAMWGVFFEDINFGADGGLYAELVKNRGFEFADAMMGWSRYGVNAENLPEEAARLEIRSEAPFNAANPHYLRLQSDNVVFGVVNEGFRGIGVRAGEDYDFSVQARAVSGSLKLRVELIGAKGAVLASARIESLPSAWKRLTATLRPNTTDAKARLSVLVEGKGSVDLDFVSLFPRKTWKNRPGGLRADMVQALADMKPGFVRFPGGCIVEGTNLANRYQWKTTIGPVEERQLIMNRWNVEFKHRLTPDYFQSFGLGFFEYFQLCEDIGAEPLPILNCGMACQFNTGELCPMDKLDVYIQDALDLIEFANGSATSTWGAKRAAMGHRAPFGMKLLGVGNEQWGPQYIERYAAFAKVLKAKHPEIQLIAATGPSPSDDRFKFLSGKLRELKADMVDEHSYAPPDWFYRGATRYDKYDRNGPKVFVGEYASHVNVTGQAQRRSSLDAAISEAAFMTGLERNADLVRMASYAPLFANAAAWQWTPDMIWVDSLRLFKTPSYHVQSLFARNRGDAVLPVKLETEDVGDAADAKVFSSATWDEATREVIVKLVNAADQPVKAAVKLSGAGRGVKRARVAVLTSANWSDVNSFEQPTLVAPRESTISVAGPRFEHELPARSLTVLRVKGN